MIAKIPRYTELAIVFLLVVVLFQLIALKNLTAANRLYGNHTVLPLESGFRSGSGQIVKAGGSLCTVLRISSDYCRYCKQDQDLYLSLADQAVSRGCLSFILGPRFNQVKSAPGQTTHIDLVDYEVGKVLKPLTTPQTLVFDRNGRLVWHRDGALNRNSADSGARVIEHLATPGGALP